MEAKANPLLDTAGLPRFDAIQPDHVGPAIDALLQDARQALDKVTAPSFPADWGAIAATLGVATERLGRAWGAVSHLNAVADTPELRAAFNASLPSVTEFWTDLGSDERLYALYKRIDATTLTAEQRQARKHALRGFVLGGADLRGDDKLRFAQIQERLAELSQKFSENTLDATDRYFYDASAAEVGGIPSDVLATARAAAQAAGVEDRYRLSLKMPCYLPVMQHAHDRELRQRLYRGFMTRASDLADEAARDLDNGAHMAEILALREQEARLLGFADYASLSLEPKMAPSPAAVCSFLRELAARARHYAEAELADLRAYARERLNLADPQAWDWAYLGERLKEERYAFSAEEVRAYFPLPRVLEGLFTIVQTLFNVEIRPDVAPTWHPAVRFFRIERMQDGKSQLLGQFYLDPSARAGKRGGAWMDDVRNRWRRPDAGGLQTPVAHLVCNFADTTQVDGKPRPALLAHTDVITLFHEFGHGLQHLLTQVDEIDVSGINGVEWDAVELPSQFMENFCWEWDVVRRMTAHVESGEPLPRSLFDKMRAARNFQSGMQTLRQIEFGLFDMLLHGAPAATVDIQQLLGTVRSEVAVVQPPHWVRSAHTFGHIFAGGYAAGYYSYKWAEVLSADAYEAFEETTQADGTVHPQTGERFLRAILEVGGSVDAMDAFKAFRGREPQLDALLRHQGMATQPETRSA